MRREPDHRPAGDGLPVFQAFDADQALHALLRRPPQDAVLEEAAAERLEMPARQPAPFRSD